MFPFSWQNGKKWSVTWDFCTLLYTLCFENIRLSWRSPPLRFYMLPSLRSSSKQPYPTSEPAGQRLPSPHLSTLPTCQVKMLTLNTANISFPPIFTSCLHNNPAPKSAWIKAWAIHSLKANKDTLTPSVFGPAGGCPPCQVFLLEQMWKTCSICLMPALVRGVVSTVRLRVYVDGWSLSKHFVLH